MLHVSHIDSLTHLNLNSCLVLQATHLARMLHDRVRSGDSNFSQGLQYHCLGNNFDPSLQFIPPNSLLLASCHSLSCISLRAAVCTPEALETEQSPTSNGSPQGLPLEADSRQDSLTAEASSQGVGGVETREVFTQAEAVRDAWEFPDSPQSSASASDSLQGEQWH